MLYAEYWGYDDRETPEDETDDEHLYFIRWYVLKDSLNTNAHSGEIWLFDPELQRIGTWDLAQLPCVDHQDQPDGLTASASGVRHGVLVRVPVSLMVTPGEYLFMVHAVDDHVAEEKHHRRKPALPLNAQILMPSLDIYAPDEALEFRRGCQIDVRILVRYYRPGDVVRLWVDGSLKADLSSPFDVGGRFAKFRYVWDTSQSSRGAHVIRVQLLRGRRVIGHPDTQRVRIFAMQWPEPGIIWGGFNMDPNNGRIHRGVDIWFSHPDYNVVGFPTKQPIQDAHEGIQYAPDTQDGSGGWRYWLRTTEPKRVDLIGERDGVPVYKTRYVWTYYAHLLTHPRDGKREDNSGNAETTGSHLHFSVFLSEDTNQPRYDSGECEDPIRWLEPETFYVLTGRINGAGNGVVVNIRGGRVDGRVKTPGERFRVYIPPGTTVTITPQKVGYTFIPSSHTVTVNSEVVEVNFDAVPD